MTKTSFAKNASCKLTEQILRFYEKGVIKEYVINVKRNDTTFKNNKSIFTINTGRGFLLRIYVYRSALVFFNQIDVTTSDERSKQIFSWNENVNHDEILKALVSEFENYMSFIRSGDFKNNESNGFYDVKCLNEYIK